MEGSDLLGCDSSFLTFGNKVSLWSSGVECARNAGSHLPKGAVISPRLHNFEKLKTRKMFKYFAVCVVHFILLQDNVMSVHISESV
jgi:hypothetical protein